MLEKSRFRAVKMSSEASIALHRSRFVNFETGNITAVSFSHKSNAGKLTPSDLRLAIGRSNGTIEIWNPRNGWFQEVVIRSGKDRSIEGLCWGNVAGEPLRLFSIGGSTVVTEWNLATGLPLKNYDCNAGVIWSIAVNEKQDRLAVGCDNGTVMIIDISGGPGSLEHDTILMRQEARILSLTWKGNDFIIGGCSDGKVRIWYAKLDDPNRGRLSQSMKVDKSKKESTLVWSVIFLPERNQIVSGDSTGAVKFWDFQFATLAQSLKVHEADVLCLTTDATNTHVFSAGVDRKIFQFTLLNSKWTNTSNRLLHGNDVRSMCSYQSGGADFLVSGGAEKRLVISTLSSFADGKFKKMPLFVPFIKNMLVNVEQRLVVMWSESTVKIWNVGQELDSVKNYRLVAKLVLKDEQDISTCDMSPDGQVLVVARPSGTKVFHLQPASTKLLVTKLDNGFLAETGCKLVKFIDNSRLVAVSSDDELFTLDLESDEDETANYIELPEISRTKSSIKVPYLNTINHLEVQGTLAVISRYCGAVDTVDLKANKSHSLVRLMNFITVVKINGKRNTVILVTAENKIFEFKISQNGEETGLLTQWSKNNTENMPKQWQTLREKCMGIFFDQSLPNKIWFWGPTWVSRLDFNTDFPLNKRRKTKKHGPDGLTITDESNFLNDGDEDDENDLDIDENLGVVSSQFSNLRQKDAHNSKLENSNFFFSEKYRPILYADILSEQEIIILEKPASMGISTGAFDLPKLIF
ncbi:U3 small nucleolar RNA-associated protein [Zygosaccharomyces mellis]|uniref:U3 small nucleolar RNA-associated protein n=1 Tax=Zygosaccharomyces mellis TaxID=42258 RepID=A0A4C2E0W0_9SACH|nr:U3 small nucleolar RNA-associated protein [Zygosaccharomyces mellis]